MRWLVCVIAALFVSSAGTPVDAKSRKPIKLVEGTTIEQQIVAAIAARALKTSGFKVALISPEGAVTELADGRAHVHLTLPQEAPGLAAALATREVISLGGLSANRPDEPMMKIVSPSLKKKWPYAQKMFKRMVLKPVVVAGLSKEARAGTPVADIVSAWWKANKTIWKPWIAASKNWMKP